MAWLIHKPTNRIISTSGDPNTVQQVFGVDPNDVLSFGRDEQSAIDQMTALIGNGNIKFPDVPYRHWVVAGDKSEVTEAKQADKDAADAAATADAQTAQDAKQASIEASLAADLAKVPGLPDISKGASDADRLRALELKVFGA